MGFTEKHLEMFIMLLNVITASGETNDELHRIEYDAQQSHSSYPSENGKKNIRIFCARNNSIKALNVDIFTNLIPSPKAKSPNNGFRSGTFKPLRLEIGRCG